MTENKRFMIDDAGTLIDMRTRETYDYVSDICSVLNELNDENEELKKEVKQLKNKINTYHEGNKTLHQTLQRYWEDRYNE